MQQAKQGYSYSLNGGILIFADLIAGALGCSIVLTLFDLMAVFAVNKLLCDLSNKKECILLSVILCIVSPLCWSGKPFYVGTLSPALYHNPTYAEMKAMSLWTLTFFFPLLKSYEHSGQILWKKYGFYVLFLTVTTAFKPNFVIAFAPTLLLYLFYDFIKTRTHNVKQEVILGISVFPSIGICALQTTVLFSADSGGSIMLWPFHALSVWSGDIVIDVLRSIAFPLLFLILVGWKNRETPYWFSVILFLISFSISVLLEDGARLGHGNFLWGTLLANLILFVVSAGYLEQRKEQSKAKEIICYLCLMAHFVFGVFFLFLFGNSKGGLL